MQKMTVPQARRGSVEEKLHQEFNHNRLFIMNSAREDFDRVIPHRAIGVVHDPEREKYGNYVPSDMASRYDALIFIDKTNALHPLHLHPDGGKMPETYPFGM